jgi:hypothetical protein
MPHDPKIIQEHRDAVNAGIADKTKRNTPEFRAAMQIYSRVIGEAEAQKAKFRFSYPQLYLRDPNDVLGLDPEIKPGVPRDQQILRTQDEQERFFRDAKTAALMQGFKYK